MMKQAYDDYYESIVKAVEEKLSEYVRVTPETKAQHLVIDAMRYSLDAGGKRVRPVLTVAFCEAMGGERAAALPAACAMEMVHTFSLIHDDLPEMDNDDYRRGRLSCHKVFGPATALLAGDALLSEAFYVLTRYSDLPPKAVARLVRELSFAAGSAGMVGGQELDMEYEKRGDITQADLEQMVRGKTGALIRAACRMGCIAAGASEDTIKKAGKYGEKLGLAFQVVDDILDITSTTEALGKPVGSDAESGKTTFATLLGLDNAAHLAADTTHEALEILESLPNHDFLTALTRELLERKK